jgi:uncharacterized protein (TIGR02266 family)
MHQERRRVRRARVSGLHVAFENASGERIEADVHDLGSGGVFVCTTKPVPVGKRVPLEIRIAAGTWSALGRVVWTRETESAEGPPGMGLKLIDLEDAAVEAIDRLVAERGEAAPSAGNVKAPPKEPTMMGVGAAGEAAARAAPIVSVKAPSRERTVLGVGGASPAMAGVSPVPRERSVQEPPAEGWDLPEAPAAPAAPAPAPAPAPKARPPVAEASIALDLMVKKPPIAEPPARISEPSSERSSEPSQWEPKLPRRRRWPAVLLLLIAGAGVGVYAMRARIPWQRLRSLVGMDSPSPPAPALAAPTASAPATTASAGSIATAPPIATASTSAAPSASASSAPSASAARLAASASAARPAASASAATASPSALPAAGKASAARPTPAPKPSKGTSNDDPY